MYGTMDEMDYLIRPFFQIFTNPPQEWHPLVVHFPIVFLISEGVLTMLFWLTRKKDYERWALYFLYLAFVSMLIAAIAGFHDVGLDLGEGNKIWLGLKDRWHNLHRLGSSVTVHLWLAVGLAVLTFLRLLWRQKEGKNVLEGRLAFVYGITIFLSLWILLALAYVGGMLSHR